MTDPLAPFGTMPTTIETVTGRSFADWQAIVRDLGLTKHGEILKALKAEHGLSHGYANMLALLATGYGQATEDDLVAGLFAGPKAAIRPIYDAVLAEIERLGDDVEVTPKKTMVTFKRSKQFACFTPSSAKRAELGIALRGDPPTERLRASNGMTSHAVWLADPAELDDEVRAWLRAAYERS